MTESSAVSVDWPLLKPDCLASSLLFWERNNEIWLKTTRSSVLAMNGLRRTFDTKGKGDKVRSLIIELGLKTVNRKASLNIIKTNNYNYRHSPPREV